MSDLAFIKDTGLRKTLEDSIEFIYVLLKKSKEDGQKLLYKIELYRIIILYVVQAIEAILLYFYKERGEQMEHVDYKFLHSLPSDYKNIHKQNNPVVIAVQVKNPIGEYDIGLYKLIKYFLGKKLIRKKTADDILELNDLRNTFHFSKPRVKNCDIARVESALQLLVHTIENAPKALKIK